MFSITNTKTNYHILERHGDTEEMMRLKLTFCEGLHKILTEFSHHWKSSNIIFDHLRPSENGKIKKKDLLSTLRHHGILSDDPRITFTVNQLEDMPDELTRIQLSTALRGEKNMKPNMNLEFITKAINNELLIPQFAEFENEIAGIFEKCRENRSGANADYIPELAKCPEDNWGLAICTVEGQRIKMGHSNTEFSIQSCSKPINYAVAMEHLGVDKVHKHVGQEPSGVAFNALIVNENGLPHNPCINAGAIMVASLLRSVGDGDSARFRHVTDFYKRMAGGRKFEYDNKVYLSEKSQPWGNKALAYLMMKTDAYPEWVQGNGEAVDQALNFYFMLCSLESDADRMSIVAGTLANNGICPLTGEQVLSSRVVRDTLSIMFCCGMYDYSGKYAFDIGVPAKSGVGGGIMIVIPGVMGVCTYAPRLDKFGNSARGVEFSGLFSQRFSFHKFSIEQDSLIQPYIKDLHYELLQTSANNNLVRVKEIVREMMEDETTAIINMTSGDYDKRTALHLACAEGNYQIAEYLLRKGFEPVEILDRWNNTPLDDARSQGHNHIVELLQSYIKKSTGGGRHNAQQQPDFQNLSAIEAERQSNFLGGSPTDHSFEREMRGAHAKVNSVAGFKSAGRHGY